MPRPIESLASGNLDRWAFTGGFPEVEREPVPAEGADVLLGGLSVDTHLAAVGAEVRARGASTATLHADVDVAGGRGLVLRPPAMFSCGAVFLRSMDFSLPLAHHGREQFVVVDPFDPQDPLHDHAGREAAAALDCWTDLIDAPKWINDPWASRRADSKALQLRVAAACGIPTPRTLVTTSRQEAAAFAAACGRVVHKSMRHPMVEEAGGIGFLHTSPVDGFDGSGADFGHPVLLQEQVIARSEYRSTVIGEQVFTVRLDQRDPSVAPTIDWRRGLPSRQVRVTPAALDADEDRALVALTSDLGLRFAAVDLIEAEDGTRSFLEVNPGGSFNWVEEAAGLPITAAIVDDLVGSGS